MLDLKFVKDTLAVVEPKASELPSKDRNAIHEMLSDILTMQVLVRSGSVVYNPNMTPRQHIVAWDIKRPKSIPGKECGAQTLAGEACTRNAWKVTGHCWQHSDASGRAKIEKANEAYRQAAQTTWASASIKTLAKRLDALQQTRRKVDN
jgi:predicted P-loop ATPase